MSIPVQVKGSPDLGHYVAAVDVRLAFQPIIRTHLTYAAVALVALVAIGIVGYQVAGKLLSPLRSLRRTAQRITETDLSERIPDDQLASKDEVGDLGRTMNAMLDRLSASFDNQRRLLDDAGHELKTPITIVRGHLELIDPHDPTDVIETRDLAIDELDRMRRLVDEILMLAKARRPDFVQPEPVVVADLLAGVLDKVIALGDRRWLIEATSNEVVTLDPQRITQALIQLVANALKFTQPGSVIALGGRIYGPEVRLWVRDEGTGIAAEDQGRIFERFGRGSDPTGTQPPGTRRRSRPRAGHRGRDRAGPPRPGRPVVDGRGRLDLHAVPAPLGSVVRPRRAGRRRRARTRAGPAECRRRRRTTRGRP